MQSLSESFTLFSHGQKAYVFPVQGDSLLTSLALHRLRRADAQMVDKFQFSSLEVTPFVWAPNSTKLTLENVILKEMFSVSKASQRIKMKGKNLSWGKLTRYFTAVPVQGQAECRHGNNVLFSSYSTALSLKHCKKNVKIISAFSFRNWSGLRVHLHPRRP